jgi:hypothetical protein
MRPSTWSISAPFWRERWRRCGPRRSFRATRSCLDPPAVDAGAGERTARGDPRRPRSADAGVPEPHGERPEIRRAGPRGFAELSREDGSGSLKGQGDPRRCHRPRRRDRSAARAAPDGTVLPGRHPSQPRHGRHGPGPRDREAHRQPPPGTLRITEREGTGSTFSVLFPEALRIRQRSGCIHLASNHDYVKYGHGGCSLDGCVLSVRQLVELIASQDIELKPLNGTRQFTRRVARPLSLADQPHILRGEGRRRHAYPRSERTRTSTCSARGSPRSTDTRRWPISR